MLLTHLHNNHCLTVLIWRKLIALFQSMALNGMGILLEPLNGISLFRGNSVALRCKNPSITSYSSLLIVLSRVYICVYLSVRKAVCVHARLWLGTSSFWMCRLLTQSAVCKLYYGVCMCLFYLCSTLKDT